MRAASGGCGEDANQYQSAESRRTEDANQQQGSLYSQDSESSSFYSAITGAAKAWSWERKLQCHLLQVTAIFTGKSLHYTVS